MEQEGELNYKDVGARIKRLRMKAGISQIELAKAINVSQTHMSNIENGNTGISLWTAVRISRKLGCSIDNFADAEKYSEEQAEIERPEKYIDIEDLIAALRLVNRERKI